MPFTAFTSSKREKVKKGLYEFRRLLADEYEDPRLTHTKTKKLNKRKINSPVNSKADLTCKRGVDLSKYG